MTNEERIAFVDAMRERGAVSVEVDGARVVFAPPAPPQAASVQRDILSADGNGAAPPMTPEEEDAERDRQMLWSTD